jgi:hypothetical protein
MGAGENESEMVHALNSEGKIIGFKLNESAKNTLARRIAIENLLGPFLEKVQTKTRIPFFDRLYRHYRNHLEIK